MDFLTVIRKQDWILNAAIGFLAIAGLISLLSVGPKQFFNQQLIWYLLGWAMVMALTRIDWRSLINYPKFIYGIYIFTIILLIVTYFLAAPIRGVRSWLVLGSFQIQTSELTKIALILVFSTFWSKAHVGIAHIKNLAISFIYFLIPAGLIAFQPDLGLVLVIFSIWFGYLLVSGIRWKHLLIALVIFIVAGIFFWFNILKDYQKDRILGAVYPERDPLGINYNVSQSKIAIGSAGFWGKGFGQGTQTQLGFLPEARTDFIFAAFTEEWGLFGGFLAIAAFLILLIRIIQIGLRSENNFARLFCLGTVILFLSHLVLNVGFNLGILPVVGVPFPFLSYGGSNLLTNLFLIGIIQSIAFRSKF
jgi:rod shape determining protein RodA